MPNTMTMTDTMKATRNAMESIKEDTERKFTNALSMFSQGAALLPWTCVVEQDQVWRYSKSGVLFEVVSVKVITADAQVRLRTVDAHPGEDDVSVRASVLCAGTAWSHLPDDEGETTAWCGQPRVRSEPQAARASS